MINPSYPYFTVDISESKRNALMKTTESVLKKYPELKVIIHKNSVYGDFKSNCQALYSYALDLKRRRVPYSKIGLNSHSNVEKNSIKVVIFHKNSKKLPPSLDSNSKCKGQNTSAIANEDYFPWKQVKGEVNYIPVSAQLSQDERDYINYAYNALPQSIKDHFIVERTNTTIKISYHHLKDSPFHYHDNGTHLYNLYRWFDTYSDLEVTIDSYAGSQETGETHPDYLAVLYGGNKLNYSKGFYYFNKFRLKNKGWYAQYGVNSEKAPMLKDSNLKKNWPIIVSWQRATILKKGFLSKGFAEERIISACGRGQTPHSKNESRNYTSVLTFTFKGKASADTCQYNLPQVSERNDWSSWTGGVPLLPFIDSIKQQMPQP